MKSVIKIVVIPVMMACTGVIAQPDTVIKNNQNATRPAPALKNNPQDNRIHTIQNPAPIQQRPTDSVRTHAPTNVSNGKSNGATQQNDTILPIKQTAPVHHNGARVDSVPSINRNINTIDEDSARVIRKTTPAIKDTIK